MRMAILLVTLLVGACAHKPESAGTEKRAPTVKVAKPVAKPAAPIEAPTPNKVIKKRWYDGFRERWLNK